MMNEKIQHCIYNALNSIGYKIETSMLSMFSEQDIYSRPPFLRFRYEDISKNDVLYSMLEDSISNFKGKMEWILTTHEKTTNYIIIPKIFEEYLKNNSFSKKNIYINDFGKEIYEKLINSCIDDIPNLAYQIRNCLSPVR